MMGAREKTDQLKNAQRSLKSVEPKSDTTYDISDLPINQQRFIQLYMTGQYSIRQLAEILDMEPNSLSRWLRRDDVSKVINQMQEDIHNQVSSQLKSLTTQAVSRLTQLVDSKVDGVALQAVNTILDRAGHRSKQEININKTVTTFEEKMNTLLEGVDVEDLEEIEAYDDEDENEEEIE